MIQTTKILFERETNRQLPTTLQTLGKLVHEPSFGRGRAPMSRKTRMKLGWEKSGMLERVVYIDDRERVIATDEYPWCLIAYLEIEFPFGRSMGTGWLVAGDKVLTAGHCLYNHDAGGWATSIKVVPGNDTEEPKTNSTEDAPYGVYHATALQTTPDWIMNSSVELDVGMIHINYPIGNDLGHFGISIYDDSDKLNGKKIRVAGYPKTYHPLDENTGSLSEREVSGQLWTHSDEIIDIRNGRIFYNLDTTGGQSGAPVVLLGLDALGLVAIGIHNYGFHDYEKHENKATLINKEIWGYIEGWLNDEL